MSADPRGAESTAESRRWYLEVSGRRAGPFAWAVLIELAQAGGLGAADRVWSMGLASWSQAADVPDLAPYIRQPAPSTRKVAPGGPRERLDGPDDLQPLLLAAAIAWIAVTVSFYVEQLERWPGVVDGVLVARLGTAGPLLLLLAGLGVLPGVWRGTRPDPCGRSGALRGGIRTSAALCTLLLLATLAGTALNERALWRTAIGADPVGPARIQLLPGGREVEIRGTLEAGVAARLAVVLRSHPRVRFVHLNSPGGWVTEGERLARIIHAGHLGTYTATGCYSACVLAFAAGSPRILNPDARLGLHSTFGLDADADPAVSRLGNEIYQKVLLRYGVSAALVAQSTSTPAGGLWMPDPQQLLAGRLIDRISAEGFSPSGESLAGFASQSAGFESRYTFLVELRRVDPLRFAQLDREVRLGFRRGAPTAELNAYVAGAAGQIERDRLAAVDDSSALRFLASLRNAARPFQSSDPAQCAAILGPLSAASPTRSAEALTAIGPALAAILDAPTTSSATAPTIEVDALQQVKEAVSQLFPGAEPGAANVGSKMRCDRWLLMYDTAMTESPVTAAAFVRALQGH